MHSAIRYCWIAVALIGASCASCRKEPPVAAPALLYPPTLGVKLLEGADSAEISVPGSCNILHYPDGVALKASARIRRARATCSGEGIRIEGCGVFAADAILLTSRQARVVVEGEGEYRGDLLLARTPNGLDVINRVNLEDYLLGVVGKEMKAAWPLEALKAQAVAARTYALYSVVRLPHAMAHVSDDVSSQVYGGVNAECRSVTRAVEDTYGFVLLEKEKIFPAFYHSCCGGQTEGPGRHFGIHDGDPALPARRLVRVLPRFAVLPVDANVRCRQDRCEPENCGVPGRKEGGRHRA